MGTVSSRLLQQLEATSRVQSFPSSVSSPTPPLPLPQEPLQVHHPDVELLVLGASSSGKTSLFHNLHRRRLPLKPGHFTTLNVTELDIDECDPQTLAVPPPPPPPPQQQQQQQPSFACGQRVMCHWREGTDLFFPATIIGEATSSATATYAVRFDDGDLQPSVSSDRLRLHTPLPHSAPGPAPAPVLPRGLVLVYSLDDEVSFAKVSDFLWAYRNNEASKSASSVPILVIGTKLDAATRTWTRGEAISMARGFGADYCEAIGIDSLGCWSAAARRGYHLPALTNLAWKVLQQQQQEGESALSPRNQVRVFFVSSSPKTPVPLQVADLCVTGPGWNHCPHDCLPSSNPQRLPAEFIAKTNRCELCLLVDCITDGKAVRAVAEAAVPECAVQRWLAGLPYQPLMGTETGAGADTGLPTVFVVLVTDTVESVSEGLTTVSNVVGSGGSSAILCCVGRSSQRLFTTSQPVYTLREMAALARRHRAAFATAPSSDDGCGNDSFPSLSTAVLDSAYQQSQKFQDLLSHLEDYEQLQLLTERNTEQQFWAHAAIEVPTTNAARKELFPPGPCGPDADADAGADTDNDTRVRVKAPMGLPHLQSASFSEIAISVSNSASASTTITIARDDTSRPSLSSLQTPPHQALPPPPLLQLDVDGLPLPFSSTVSIILATLFPSRDITRQLHRTGFFVSDCRWPDLPSSHMSHSPSFAPTFRLDYLPLPELADLAVLGWFVCGLCQCRLPPWARQTISACIYDHAYCSACLAVYYASQLEVRGAEAMEKEADARFKDEEPCASTHQSRGHWPSSLLCCPDGPGDGCGATLTMSEATALLIDHPYCVSSEEAERGWGEYCECVTGSSSSSAWRECPECGLGTSTGSLASPSLVCSRCGQGYCFAHGALHPGATCEQWGRIQVRVVREAVMMRAIDSPQLSFPQAQDVELRLAHQLAVLLVQLSALPSLLTHLVLNLVSISVSLLVLPVTYTSTMLRGGSNNSVEGCCWSWWLRPGDLFAYALCVALWTASIAATSLCVLVLLAGTWALISCYHFLLLRFRSPQERGNVKERLGLLDAGEFDWPSVTEVSVRSAAAIYYLSGLLWLLVSICVFPPVFFVAAVSLQGGAEAWAAWAAIWHFPLALARQVELVKAKR